MKRYRVYLLNDLGQIFHDEEVEALDDADAVAAAWNLLENHNATQPDLAYGIEVRLGGTLIYNSWTRSS